MEFFDTKKEINNKNISSYKKVDVNSKSENSIQFKNRKGRINIYNSNVTIYTHYYRWKPIARQGPKSLILRVKKS